MKINNPFADGEPFFDAYIRFVNDFRISTDYLFFKVINHLIVETEAKDEPHIIRSPHFATIMPDLEEIRKRYGKRKFNVDVRPDEADENTKIYNEIAKGLKSCLKSSDYSILEILDLIYYLGLHGKDTSDITLPKTLAWTLGDKAGRRYNHKIPADLAALIEKSKGMTLEHESEAPSEFRMMRKYENLFDIYANLMDKWKYSVDMELMKLYDTLLEKGKGSLKSDKIFLVLEDVLRIGEQEYGKQALELRLQRGFESHYLEQWCADLNRVYSDLLHGGADFRSYLRAERKSKDGLLRGDERIRYPELQTLIERIDDKG